MNTITVDSIVVSIKKEYHFLKGIEPQVTIGEVGAPVLSKVGTHGLTISVDHRRAVTKITLSSKVLREKFLRLISTATIADVLQRLRSYIEISEQELMTSTVCKVDVTTDLHLQQKVEILSNLYDLAALQTQFSRTPKIYKSGGLATSFYLKQNNISKGNIVYLSVYRKMPELLKFGQGRGRFIDSLSIADRERALIEAESILRFEVKLSSRHKIRKHFELPEKHVPTLEDILKSNTNVTRNLLEKVYGRLAQNRKPQFKCSNSTDLAMSYTLAMNDYCLERSLAAYKSQLPTSVKSRTKKKMSQILAGLNASHHCRMLTTYDQLMQML